MPAEQRELAERLSLDLNYDFNGEAYQTVSGQNSNNSVRLPDSFFEAVLDQVYTSGPRFAISFPRQMSRRPLDGQIVLTVSDMARRLSPDTAAPKRRTFEVDIRDLEAGEEVIVDSSTFADLASLYRGCEAARYDGRPLGG